MNKVRFLIKVTYLDGPHAGKVHLIEKGGYVSSINEFQWEDTTYASRAFAQKVCNQRMKEYDFEFEWERRNNEAWIKKGFKGKTENQFIYWHERWEPISVDPSTGRVNRSELTTEEIKQLEESARW